jgi:hypothetical protein
MKNAIGDTPQQLAQGLMFDGEVWTKERIQALQKQAKDWQKAANSWSMLCGKLTAYMASHKIDITSKKAKQALAERDAEISKAAFIAGAYRQRFCDDNGIDFELEDALVYVASKAKEQS